MKKTYINPESKVVKLQTMQMLATSTTIDMVDGTPITSPEDIGAHEFEFDPQIKEDDFLDDEEF